MKKKRTVAFAMMFGLLALLATDVALGKSDQGKGKNSKAGDVKIEMELELQPVEGRSIFGVTGAVEYKKKSNNKASREKFKAALNIPGEALGVLDWHSARSAHLELRLYRAGYETPYALCPFGLHEFEQEFNSGVLTSRLEYRVDLDFLFQTGGTWRFRKKAGTCDLVNVDFSVTEGVPSLQDQDLALVVLVSPETESAPSSEMQLLWGIFDPQ